MLREPADDLEELLERNVIHELDGLTEEFRGFIINMHLTWVFTFRITNNQRGELRQFLIFDEAKMVYSEDRARPSSPKNCSRTRG